MVLYIYLIALLLLAAMFTALEIAFFSMDELEFMTIVYSRHKNADKLMKLKADKDNLLLSILICTNAINISASALNAFLAYDLAIKYGYNPDIFVGVATAILTVVIIIFCEAIPKIIGIRLKQELCIFFTPFLAVINTAARPFTGSLLIIFQSFSKLKQTLTKAKPEHYQKAFVGLTEKSVQEGLIGQTEGEIIRNVMALNRPVETIMRPRNQVFTLKSKYSLKQALPKLSEQSYSRIPIFEDSIDNINGVVYLRNIFDAYFAGRLDVNLSKIAAKPIFIRDSWTIWNVLNILRSKKQHLGIVIDEFGGMRGIITLEDILEELVGDIADEKQQEEPEKIATQADNHWQIQGSIEIRELNRKLNCSLPVDEDYDTLQGFLMDRLKRIPARHDRVVFDDQWLFIVLEMGKNEVKTVEVIKSANETES